MWVTYSSAAALTPTAVALGNFDGLHLGHQQVVLPILNRAEILAPLVIPPRGSEGRSSHDLDVALAPILELAEPFYRRLDDDNLGISPSIVEINNKGYKSNLLEPACATVVTFSPHPQEFFSGQPRKMLTPLKEKLALLKSMGVEKLVLLPFDRELAALTPKQFVEEILVRQLQATRISVGLDFRFGRGRAGTATDLAAIAANYGIDTTLVPLYTYAGERISSSAIREALQNGNLLKANQLLGRPYSLCGVVVEGQKIGRTIGFPTANLLSPPEKFLPRFGVYAVRVVIEEETEEEFSGKGEFKLRPETMNLMPKSFHPPVLGVMNIGCRPTVEGVSPTVEVHLLDYSGDLYGKTLNVSLENFLRPEQKFPSLEALKAQIQSDCAFARKLLYSNQQGD
ncbi:bifunctional riboflavin kinase/FAD synthetase [Kamptonema sp. UHCC 0994]|uniref:bifunctional riboflavin kinase/FAD synthetase n=1 Tax=Kamptonema sp. UHCC 0994 TaxID=3031329 RepID=UPI0023BAFBE2|nr:bifunctional riboflavin kinase/FAD synthetase [Kamptonema sp. UHCC 0994]MDF0556278.1 bifunctional riboflavin kinase/FAD synthetase [Kamptonema sp. UHCC 0994]